jgi:hypothetical protein
MGHLLGVRALVAWTFGHELARAPTDGQRRARWRRHGHERRRLGIARRVGRAAHEEGQLGGGGLGPIRTSDCGSHRTFGGRVRSARRDRPQIKVLKRLDRVVHDPDGQVVLGQGEVVSAVLAAR